MAKISPEKLPPQNIEAEKSVLGAILVDKESINKVVDFLRTEDFYQYGHQLIYQAVINLFERREPIDLLSLSSKLKEMGVVDQTGGIAYLTSLANSVPTSAHIASYAKIVQRKKMLRDLIDAAHHIIGLGYHEEDDLDNILDEAERRLFSVSQRSLTKSFLPVKDTLTEARTRIFEHDGELRGFTTGYKGLDDKLGGLHKSDLIILAARPSVGKTAFAMNLALRFAKTNDCSVGVFSLEMSTDQVVDRLIAVESNASLYHLRTGKLSKESQADISDALDRLASVPIFVDDSPSINILQMRAMARRLQSDSSHKLGLIIVDYLQLMMPRKNYESAVQQVTEISRGLKTLAKEMNIPIIALSQLSRAIEQRDGHKRPRLSDLRDSGSIEQDADLVLFIHREDKNKDPKDVPEEEKNVAELIIAKHRNGPTGSLNFRINPDSLEYTEQERFRNDDDIDMWGPPPSAQNASYEPEI